MNALRTAGAKARKTLVAVAVVMLTITATGSTARAEGAVTPANGGYLWSTAWSNGTGGAKEIVQFGVTGGDTAKLQTLRGICRGHYGVMYSFGSKQGRLQINQDQFTKSKKVTLDGDTATITVHVKWNSPQKAQGWIKVTGNWAGKRCFGVKKAFRLSYYK